MYLLAAGLKLRLLPAVDKRDKVLVESAEHGRECDGEKDSQNDIHTIARNLHHRAVTKACKEQVMDEIELERDGSEEL